MLVLGIILSLIYVTTVEAGGCPLFCSEDKVPLCCHSPIGGYKTFPDKCALEQENNCNNGDWNLIYPGQCKPVVQCKPECKPICAYSSTKGYKSFLNKCLFALAVELALDGYEFSHEGPCTPLEVPDCPGSCTLEFKPVCAYDPNAGYKTFSNKCFLDLQNKCYYSNYVLIHPGECLSKEIETNCKRICIEKYDPVCALSPNRGYKTFSNLCFFYLENGCPKYDGDFKLIHSGECTPDELGELCKPGFCPDIDSPVCAFGPPFFRTFPNKCLFYVANICQLGSWNLKHPGACTAAEIGYSCKSVCPEEFAPVCGYSFKRGFKTFSSKSFLNYENSCYGTDYDFMYAGKCKIDDLGLICKKEFCLQLPIKPVCALSPTKGYATFSNERLLFSENTCKYGDYKLEYFGECTEKELGLICKPEFCLKLIPLPVCAYNPIIGYFTFPNLCFLNAEIKCKNLDFKFNHGGKCSPLEVEGKCPLQCTQEYDPICAYSPIFKYKTFSNKCLLEAENSCNGGDYGIKHPGDCTKEEIEINCQLKCPLDFKPVCGRSPTKGYYTFPNKCFFVLEVSCKGADYSFEYGGVCKNPVGPVEGCPAVCPKEEKPVCGYSYTKGFKDFLSRCLLEEENKCKLGDYILAHSGKCTKTEIVKKCPRNCPLIYKPVCGISVLYGHRTFFSLCELSVANKCDNGDYSLKHVGKCSPEELGGSCNHDCPLFYLGVCGHSPLKGYKTFANECFLDRDNTCTYSDYKIVHPGKCSPAELGGKCNRLCQRLFAPVCGKSNVKGFKTFPNFCALDQENSCGFEDYGVIHQGECFPWELCVNCK